MYNTWILDLDLMGCFLLLDKSRGKQMRNLNLLFRSEARGRPIELGLLTLVTPLSKIS